MTPRTERIAYQCWYLIQQTGGDCTLHDMAEFTGETWRACQLACVHKGIRDYRRVTRNIEGSHFGNPELGATMAQTQDFFLNSLWGAS